MYGDSILYKPLIVGLGFDSYACTGCGAKTELATYTARAIYIAQAIFLNINLSSPNQRER